MQFNQILLLADAIKFYESKGFEYVEVPWTQPFHRLSESLRDEEFPKLLPAYDRGHYFVGSAEQSLAVEYAEGRLEKKKLYQSVTPCFRGEDRVTGLHKHYFYKLELFSTKRDHDTDYHHSKDVHERFTAPVIEYAQSLIAESDEWFRKLTWDNENGDLQLSVVSTKDANKNLTIELGSYNHHMGLDTPEDAWRSSYPYFCGTGMALPRWQLLWDDKYLSDVVFEETQTKYYAI